MACAASTLRRTFSSTCSRVTSSSPRTRVVVGDQRHGGVTDLRLAGQLGLLQVRHADDVEAQLPVHVRLRARRELRSLDAHVGAALVHRGADLAAGLYDLARTRTGRTGRRSPCARRCPRRRRCWAAPWCGRRADRAPRCRAA